MRSKGGQVSGETVIACHAGGHLQVAGLLSGQSLQQLLAYSLHGPGDQPSAVGDRRRESRQQARRVGGGQESGVIKQRIQELALGSVKRQVNAGISGCLRPAGSASWGSRQLPCKYTGNPSVGFGGRVMPAALLQQVLTKRLMKSR